MSKRIIMADVDGVLLNWSANLPFYANKHGIDPTVINQMYIDGVYRHGTEIFGVKSSDESHSMIIDYHHSEFGRMMPAYDDAVAVINRLKNDFDFIAVTAFGTHPRSVQNRTHNLDILFPGVFKEIRCVSGSKLNAFYQIEQKYGKLPIAFVDDRAEHISECRRVWSRYDVKTFQLCRGIQEHDDSRHICHSVRDWNQIEQELNR